LELEGYSDANVVADPAESKSTASYVDIVAGGAGSWASQVQATVATSTTEAEYMGAAQSTKEVLWLRKLMATLTGHVGGGVPMWLDNQGALALAKDPVNHQRAKHIDVCYQFVRERVALGEYVVDFCPPHDMLADVLTKTVAKSRHEDACRHLGLLSIS
jgi:hypothetical protein